MKTLSLAKICSETTSVPFRTVMGGIIAPLQASKLVTPGSRGKHGGAEMTSADRINAFLGCVLDHPRAVPLGESVRKVRSLEMYVGRLTHGLDQNIEQGIRGAFGFVDGLRINALSQLGTALDSILDDMRSGAFAKWAASGNASVSLDFSRQGTAALLVMSKDKNSKEGAYFGFGLDSEFRPNESGVDRIIRVHTKAFERLAKDTT